MLGTPLTTYVGMVGMDARCRHERTEPVTLSSGEVVAKVCADCLERLDFRHGCPDCEWEDIHVAQQLAPIATVLVYDCGGHHEGVVAVSLNLDDVTRAAVGVGVATVSIDDGGGGWAEGIVLRTPDRSVIAKARFQDYNRTLRRQKK
jgi:hypothetical protein